MSDIFLSYASEDVEHAGRLAQALSRHGWSVWWDRSILPGKIFDKVIEAELSAAKCVIVLWTRHSVESRWVRAEAGEALDKGRLIPVLLDESVIPLVFRQVQAASLIGWDGGDAHPGFQHLLKAVGALVQPHTPTTTTAAHAAAGQQHTQARAEPGASRGDIEPDHRRGWWALVAVCVLAIAGGAGYLLRGDYSDKASLDTEDLWPYTPPKVIATVKAPADPAGDTDTGGGTSAAEEPPEQPPDAQADATEAAETTPPVAKPVPPEPKPPKHESPAVAEATPAPKIVAKTEPLPTPDKSPAPLNITVVAWAMPNDNGTASDAQVKKYSTQLSGMMTSVVEKVIGRPTRFEYYYPNQKEYYRFLNDKDRIAAEKMCGAHGSDLVISGFIKGAEFVSVSFGYALTREPVFSVFDCKSRKKIEKSYQVAERVDDSFPYEQATTAVFRRFLQQEAALAKP